MLYICLAPVVAMGSRHVALGFLGKPPPQPRQRRPVRSMVASAISRAQREKPSIFSGHSVVDRPAYQLAVAQVLERDFELLREAGSSR
jgi:hypothetical protein